MSSEVLQLVLETTFFFFVLRVLGQVFVYYKKPTWLPPFDHWYSGTISYRAVLYWQTYMLTMGLVGVLEVRFKLDIFSHPFWAAICPATIVFSYLYFGGMIFRYGWTMARKPERRWFKRTIPIWAHIIAAIYLCCLCKLLLEMYG